MKASKILVTGAFGFLGRYVSRFCAQAGHKVYGIGHGSWTEAEWRQWGLHDWHSADITLDAIMSYAEEPDIIMHCAGSSSVGFSMVHPAQDFNRTVVTTRDILEYVRLYRPQARVVLPSSASVYGNAQEMPISVLAPLCPVSPYGLHKQIAEELCLSYSKHFAVSVAIVRLFSVYGVGLRKQLMWDACTKFLHGSATFGGTGEELRDWLHVEDAAKLLLAAGCVNSSGHLIVNGATGVGISTCRIIKIIANAFRSVPLAQFSGVSRPGDPFSLIADIRETQVLGWRPEGDLEAEIARYVEWFKVGAP